MFFQQKRGTFVLLKNIMEQIKGKQILLTGATGGIGLHTARLLKQSGARLFITGRDQEKLQAIARELLLEDGSYVAADLTSEADVNQLTERYFAFNTGIDALINASGIGIIKPIDQLDEADFIQTININLIAPFRLIKAFLPSMKEHKKGLIVHIPGVLGKVPMAGAAAYAAAKYGLVGMLQSIREEIKRTDIRITNLILGGVDSPFWDTIDLRVQRDKMIRSEEAAKAIWFLCQQPDSGVISEMVLQPFNHQAI
ncbi:MAG: SDR family oxidoreductase [Ferruginibacter sp.]